MTLQMLEYFIALAEYRSFTEAAAARFVTQPALSRAISALEEELGCALVDRDKRKNVVLTPAGRILLIEAQYILKRMEMMRERVIRADLHPGGEINMGYLYYGLLDHFNRNCAEAISSLADDGIFIQSVFGAVDELRERVLSGQLDCALLLESSTYSMPCCRTIPVYKAEKRIMVPYGHPLFGRSSVYLKELKDTPFIAHDPAEYPLVYAENIEIPRRAGVTPRIIDFARMEGDLTSRCKRYGAVAIVNTTIDYVQKEDLRLVRIRDPFIDEYRTTYVLVMLENPVNPLMEAVASAIEEIQQKECGLLDHDKNE